ncbi:MAG: malonyl-CoA O-methyltransferase [Bacteroidia bacterium]|jgi:malonyl-CoA O-methyltransferase
MRVEFLPATQVARQDLVLLHGWGCNREVWRPLLAYLRPWANITLLDIPGCAPGVVTGATPNLERLIESILNGAPEHALYVGWSLGGQLAAQLAQRAPDRVVGLVTLCSNPRFVAREDWPGMAPDVFSVFQREVASDVAAALRRFDGLQSKGSGQQRRLMGQLRAARGGSGTRELMAGINWLESLDLRVALADLPLPQLHLLAEQDALVPIGVVSALADLLQSQDCAEVRQLPDLSHLAPLEAPQEIAENIYEFALRQSFLAPANHEPQQSLAKSLVAASFSRAAQVYDSVAGLQRDVGTQLLGSLAQCAVKPRTLLDLGSGTGHFRKSLRQKFPDAHYIGLDIAEGMVRYAKRDSDANAGWLIADAEALPLAADSVDLVFSSLSIQWCERPQHLFAELARVLRPGGYCVFTSLGPQTLCELRSAWASVDAHQHVNQFLPLEALVDAAQSVPGIRVSVETRNFQMHYARVGDLLNELKTLGAHNMNRERAPGLTSRRALQTMLQSYEEYRHDGQLPATYEVLFGFLERVETVEKA